MKNEPKIFAAALNEVLAGKGEEAQKKMARSFLELLKRKKKAHLLPNILKELELLEKEKTVTLVLARELDQEAISSVEEKLRMRLGQDKKFKVEIDNSIIGGFKAKTNNFLIDSSIKTIIGNIRQKLV
jgi:F0F1-type ATP synthase delta subunit